MPWVQLIGEMFAAGPKLFGEELVDPALKVGLEGIWVPSASQEHWRWWHVRFNHHCRSHELLAKPALPGAGGDLPAGGRPLPRPPGGRLAGGGALRHLGQPAGKAQEALVWCSACLLAGWAFKGRFT